jgi:large subunit ribosomal protein L15
MQIHTLKATAPRKTAKRIGRGGKRGKTSGRGGKGQTARTGNSGRPEMRDVIKRLPKLRGHGKNRSRTVNSERVLPAVVNIGSLESIFESGSQVTPATLLACGLTEKRGGKVQQVKLLGTGELTKSLTVSGCTVSASAREKIEKAGGTIVS